MKAAASQLPGNNSQTDGLTTKPNMARDAFWSQLRRLKAQVQSLELAASTARRDINRIDKKQYRDIDKTPPSEVQPTQEEVSALWR